MKSNKPAIRVLLTIVVFNCCFLSTFYSQVSYNGAGIYGLRKIIPSYTNSAIQVVRSCDNATANIGFTSCGDLDTNALKKFVLVPNPLSALSATSAGAYSLRKLSCSYSGNAINVRRSCDNVTRDIGFTALGDLDTASLKTFVLASNPLTALSVNSGVAYSLRKLRCAYAGSAIRVRRSSDNTTADIGFTTSGDLDTAALKIFVGGGNSGFVSIWYDQSGNGINVAPPATTNQPRIVNAGVIDRKNGVPTIFFDGVNDYFFTNSFSTTGYTGFSASVLAAWTTVGTSVSNIQALIDNNHSCGGVSPGFVIQDRPDIVNRPITAGLTNPTMCSSCPGASCRDVLTTGNGSLRLITWINTTTLEFLYRDGINVSSGNYCGAYTIQSQFLIGAWNTGPGRFFSGQMSEVILFKSALSNTDRQYLEWGQSQYYNIYGPTLSSTLPAAAPSAFVTTWYDQSGNGRNAAQTTTGNQPRIINTGNMQRQNGLPSIFFGGSSIFLTAPALTGVNATGVGGNVTTANAVFQSNSSVSGALLSNGDLGGSNRYNIHAPWSDGISYFDVGTTGGGRFSTSLSWTGFSVGTFMRDGAVGNIWKNGTNAISVGGLSTNVTSALPLNIGGMGAGGFYMVGNISELSVFPSALNTSDRQFIEWSQSQYYGITGPVLGTFPAAAGSGSVITWYDQSGTGADVRPTGGSIRAPQIVRNGAIVRQSVAASWPAIQGTSASQTNLTYISPSTYTGNVFAFNSIIRSDIGSSANLRVISIGNTALTSSDYNNANYFNVNQRSTNQFFIERNSIISPSITFTVGAPMVLSGTFNGINRQLFLNGTGSATQGDVSSFNFNSMRLLQSINPGFEATEALTGKMSEIGVFVTSCGATRRTLLESNQAAYFNIAVSNNKYTPPTTSSYNRYVLGIGRESATDSVCASRQSAGMGFTLSTNAAAYLKDNGDYLTAGINCPITNTTNLTFLPAPITQRWDNDWYINKTDVAGTTGGTLSIYFDFVDYNVSATPGVASNYSLLARSSTAVNFSVVPTAVPSVSGNRVYFTVDANDIANNAANSGYYTIGSKNPSASPLPVELLSFSADRCDQKVCLNWKTATETNSQRFDVERSADGLNWTKITELKAAGNSQRVLNYFALDSEPLFGIGYYRINMIDLNETSKYSQTKAIEFKNGDQVQIYPNPSDGTIAIKNCENYNIVFIEDLSGRRVFTKEINSADVSLELSTLQGGAYFVTLKNLVTGLQFTSKIIVVKK